MFGFSSEEKAYIAPFAAFLGLLAFVDVVKKFGDGYANWVFSSPSYWVFPLQILVCGGLLIRFWPHYQLKAPTKLLLTTAIGILVLFLWIWMSPLWLGVAKGIGIAKFLGIAESRTEGFLPHFFGDGLPYAINLTLRFIRLVIIVPLVEEIFWRGFLLRFVIRHDFTKVPFGTFDWKSFSIVTAGFCLEHSSADWPGAILAGALYNLLAYRSRSLSSCVLAHAITNLLLGFYVLRTGQWGYW
jgi:CAAX prenyl protease-like protein